MKVREKVVLEARREDRLQKLARSCMPSQPDNVNVSDLVVRPSLES